jgi:hypothetical protein
VTAVQPLYVREGSRFVPLDEARPVRPPIPTPLPVPVDDVEPDERSNFTAVPAPRCPHGSFARWAASNCCAERSPR